MSDDTFVTLSASLTRTPFAPRDVNPWVEFALRSADSISICGLVHGQPGPVLTSCYKRSDDRASFHVSLVNQGVSLIDAVLDSRDVAASVLRSAIHRLSGLTRELNRNAPPSDASPAVASIDTATGTTTPPKKNSRKAKSLEA